MAGWQSNRSSQLCTTQYLTYTVQAGSVIWRFCVPLLSRLTAVLFCVWCKAWAFHLQLCRHVASIAHAANVLSCLQCLQLNRRWYSQGAVFTLHARLAVVFVDQRMLLLGVR